MPTPYPKCTPTEMMGLLVLLDSHGGAEDLARLADDLDLEIDEILPSTDFAETLGLVDVADGRVSFTEEGRKLLASTIRERKILLRGQLSQTTLFRALLGALETSPEHRLSDEEVHRLVAFTTAAADELILNIINWGRFTELFRYDPDEHLLLPSRTRRSARTGSGGNPPGTGGSEPVPPRTSRSRTTPASDDTSGPPTTTAVLSITT